MIIYQVRFLLGVEIANEYINWMRLIVNQGECISALNRWMNIFCPFIIIVSAAICKLPCKLPMFSMFQK